MIRSTIRLLQDRILDARVATSVGVLTSIFQRSEMAIDDNGFLNLLLNIQRRRDDNKRRTPGAKIPLPTIRDNQQAVKEKKYPA